MKKKSESSGSIGVNIFITTLGIVSVVLLMTSLIFLAVFSGTLDDLVESQTREINKQIVMNFEGYINSVIETANYIQFKSLNLDVERDAAVLAELYKTNTDIKKDVVSIILFDNSGRWLAGPPLDFRTANSISTRPWFLSAVQIKENFHFSAEQDTSLVENRDERVIAVSKSVEFVQGGKVSKGVLLIELNKDALTDLAKKTNLGEHGHLLILNERGKLLYSSEAEPATMTGQTVPIAAEMFLGSRRVTINRTDMYLNVNTLMHTRWLIVTVSNVNQISAAMSRLAGILFVIFLVVIAVSAMVAGLISLRVSRPISQLKNAMLKIENGDFSVPVEVSGQREIVSLAHSFNNMIMKIQELLARLLDQQREKRKMELQALQNQINPHFLYNTLDSIVWLAEHQRSKDVITTVVSLARFFRISISKGEIFIPVEDEISHVENYLTIQSIRYGNKFTYTIEIDEEIRGLKVMKLILQPLVENAIYHGVGDEDGHIDITGGTGDGFIVFTVTNTGYGISDSKIAEMYATMRGGHERPSVGIRNVYQRLKLYYGDRSDVRISSVMDESTTVSLYIPKDIQEELK